LYISQAFFSCYCQALDEAEGYETDPKERLRLHLERYAVLKAWAQKKYVRSQVQVTQRTVFPSCNQHGSRDVFLVT